MQLYGGLSMHTNAAMRSEADVGSYDGAELVTTATAVELAVRGGSSYGGLSVHMPTLWLGKSVLFDTTLLRLC